MFCHINKNIPGCIAGRRLQTSMTPTPTCNRRRFNHRIIESHDQRAGCDPAGITNSQHRRVFNEVLPLVTYWPGSIETFRVLLPCEGAHWICQQRMPTPSRGPHTMMSTCWCECHLQRDVFIRKSVLCQLYLNKCHINWGNMNRREREALFLQESGRQFWKKR